MAVPLVKCHIRAGHHLQIWMHTCCERRESGFYVESDGAEAAWSEGRPSVVRVFPARANDATGMQQRNRA